MKIPPLHPREDERVAALREYNILDTLPESSYDDLVFLASQICDAPIALISLIDQDRQWFKSKIGLDAAGSPREVSFCAHAILQNGVFEVSDTLQDERFVDNPAVAYWPNIRFYAGTPLVTPDGLPLGTLCVVDRTPRHLSPEQIRALEALGRQVMSQLEMRLQTEELRHKTQELEEQQRLFDAFMDYSPAAAFLKDEAGRMLYVNRKFQDTFGRAQEDFIGRTDDELWPPDVAARLRDNDHEIFRTNRAMQMVETTTHPRNSDDVSTHNADESLETREWLSVKFPLQDGSGRRLLGGVALDITEQERQAKQLRETLRLQKAMLDHAPYAIIATDAQGNIALLNRAAERMKGYEEAQVLGKSAALLINDHQQIAERAQLLSQELGRTIEPGFEVFVARARLRSVDEQEWELVHRNGTRTPVLMAVAALRDEAENITGFLGIVQDISERKRVERLKNEFVSTVSHELRTPLTSIRGSLGLLIGGVAGELPERAEGMITIAHNNAERLVRLINDILDIEKIESGKMTLDFQVYDIATIVYSALEANRSYGENLGVRFELHDDLQSGFMVRADSDRLEQVLANLLSNAAKYSPRGEKVCVRLERVAHQGRDAVRVSVEDHGPGVPAEFCERIFGKFAQADSSDTRQKGGTGLGLAISKSLIEQMNGEIGFESQPGRTIFHFTLPQAQSPSCEYSPNARPRILVCEDDRDVAHLLEIMLERDGVEAQVVHSAKAARELLQREKFDAMTLDLTLPDGDGLSLLRELRAGDATRDLPVIVVSARATPGDESRGDALPADEPCLECASLRIADWLGKPIEQSRLAQALQHVLHRDRAKHDGARPCILHVEDDADVRAVVASVLHREADVTWANDVAQARSLLQNRNFDLVLLDLELPGEAGTELLRDLPPGASQTPVVIFSASEARADAAQQIKAALVKARTSNEELLQTVRSLLRGEQFSL